MPLGRCPGACGSRKPCACLRRRSLESLSSDLDVVDDSVGRMEDDDSPGSEPCRDLDVEAAAMAELDVAKMRATELDRIDRPAILVAKHGACWNRQHVIAVPRHDPRLDAKPIAERGRRIDH